MNKFGKTLKELRQEQSMSQKNLAEILGVSHVMISLYENNASEPSLETFIKIAKHFDVSTDYLLGIKEF